PRPPPTSTPIVRRRPPPWPPWRERTTCTTSPEPRASHSQRPPPLSRALRGPHRSKSRSPAGPPCPWRRLRLESLHAEVPGRCAHLPRVESGSVDRVLYRYPWIRCERRVSQRSQRPRRLRLLVAGRRSHPSLQLRRRRAVRYGRVFLRRGHR